MNKDLFTRKDLEQIHERGISRKTIEIQLDNFRKGFPPISLVAPATATDGILPLSGKQVEDYAKQYEERQGSLRIVKFTPASGAASRMFKSLFEYLNKEGADPGKNISDPAVAEIIRGLDKLALTGDLEDALRRKGEGLNSMVTSGDIREIIRSILDEDGLNYGQLPKGLIKFHKYPQECRTPVEEHMMEGAEYCMGMGDAVNLHFTVSEEHLPFFKQLIDTKKPVFEKRYGVRLETDFSLQHPCTDIIAVDPDNRPFREKDGSILFRPGGHGALLANLDRLDADLIFIKNIDNVCPDRMKPPTYLYKKALAGILIESREKAFQYLRLLDSGDHSMLGEIERFLGETLNFRFPPGDKALQAREKAELFKKKLNRPMRVCGMVRNEGEPGGGPFWCRNRDGSVSLQIVESTQIDFRDPAQAEIAANATHFNPVDLVCATRDYSGRAFDLSGFTDPETGLISEKSSDGRKLKAQELPGLWNGSMSDWNTLFVEVPIETFNPVKTINDLLRPEHLA